MSFAARFATRNVGRIDRLISAVPVPVLVLAWKDGVIDATTATILVVPAFLLLLRSITARCPVLALLGRSTNGQEEERPGRR